MRLFNKKRVFNKAFASLLPKGKILPDYNFSPNKIINFLVFIPAINYIVNRFKEKIMTIRKAVLNDAVSIIKLLAQLDYNDTEKFIDNKISQFSKDENEMILIAEENEIVYGLMSIHFIPQLAMQGDIARISYFCVDEESRSRGIGDLLERECVKIAGDRNCERIEVHCHSRRNDAHRFYQRQGFIEEPKYFVKELK